MKNEIKIIGIITLIYDILDLSIDMSYQEEITKVLNWCAENNYHYYARGRDDFFEFEAVEEAQKKGCVGVVLENLS
jgi:hypothetical protein